MDAVAIGHMHMGDTVPETAGQVGGRNAHQLEMRDVDSRLHIDKPDLVEEALHRIERIDEREFEGQQLDCEFESFLCRMLAHQTRRIDHEIPFRFRRNELLLEHILAGHETEIAGACKLSRKIDDIFGALDVIIADCRIEITEAQAGADERHDRQARALILSDITFAVGFRHPPRIEADEEIETFETDALCLLAPVFALIVRAEPG
jgi:hypothetical protein